MAVSRHRAPDSCGIPEKVFGRTPDKNTEMTAPAIKPRSSPRTLADMLEPVASPLLGPDERLLGSLSAAVMRAPWWWNGVAVFVTDSRLISQRIRWRNAQLAGRGQAVSIFPAEIERLQAFRSAGLISIGGFNRRSSGDWRDAADTIDNGFDPRLQIRTTDGRRIMLFLGRSGGYGFNDHTQQQGMAALTKWLRTHATA